MTRTPTYDTWQGMKDRCSNQNNSQFKNYGARGIKVCSEWLDFEIFLSDMGERPEGKTIDRIDNNKGYSKDNCRWATDKEQVDNRRVTIFFTYNDKKMCLKDWCRHFNKPYSTAMYHYKKGRTFEEIFDL
jgi:hypothetical protein